ncbi:MAG: DUF1887 family protein [Clostridia bacterium]|nr:DUF1887 family protein [Clostridia bacterium]
MTTVEFLYRCPTENIASALTLRPDKIIFIGNKSDKRENIYTRFIKSKSPSTKTEFIYTDTSDLYNLIDILSDIVKSDTQITFDLTGGEDLLLTAMGVMVERFKNITIQRFNINQNRLISWQNGEKTEKDTNASLSVEEQITLHGGMIIKNTADEIILNKHTAPVIDALWSVFKRDKHYNTNVKLLQRALKLDRDGRDLVADISIPEFKSSERDDRTSDWLIEFLQFLKDGQIVDSLNVTTQRIKFSFKSGTAKELLEKSGNILEMMVYKTAATLKNDNGAPHYTDLMRSVIIDWDGKVGSNKTGDTKNEIDCIFMKNLVPVFISCKGGDIEEAELYKLDAVANRFGGKYAKRVLISTNHGKDEIAAAYFRKRAEDMNITLLENVHLLTEGEFLNMIKELV